MQHTSRRTLHRVSKIAAAGLSLGVVAAFGLATPASAAPGAAGAYVSSSKATLIHVSALNGQALGLGSAPLVDLDIATAGSAINSAATPQSTSSAQFLKLSLAGQKVLDIPELDLAQIGTAALQANPQPVLKATPALTRPLMNMGPGSMLVGAAGLPSLDSLANLDAVNNVTGVAGLAGVSPLQGLAPLGQNALSLDSFTALPIGAGLVPTGLLPGGLNTSMFEIPSLLNAKSQTELVKVAGQNGSGLLSTSSVSLAEAVLFKGTAQQLTVKIISRPTLTVMAAGSRKSTVEYSSPILEIIDASGKSTRLDAPDEVFEAPLAGAGALGSLTSGLPQLPLNSLLGGAALGNAAGVGSVKISIGHLDKKITKNSVTARAATFRVEIGDVLHLAVGDLNTVAQVPTGGIGGESPEPTATDDGDGGDDGDDGGDGGDNGNGGGNGDGGGLPVTGTSLTLILGAGAAMVVLGMLARRFARRLH